MKTPQDPEAAETVQTTDSPAVVQERLVLRLRRWARELIVVGLVATILVVAFGEVITKEGKPWWAHILAWLAVWATYDLMKLRSKSLHNDKNPATGSK